MGDKNDTKYGLGNDLKNIMRLGVTEEEIREIKTTPYMVWETTRKIS
jgi:hypothetical protein